jgi:hypothetical protein
MRLRFSLRLAFILLTVAAVALYWLVARPTILANQFVSAINSRDFEAAKKQLPDFWLFNSDIKHRGATIDRVYAEIFPREWSDIWTAQRRVILRLARHNDNHGQHVEWTEDTDIVARLRGLEMETPSGLNSTWLDVTNSPSSFRIQKFKLEWNKPAG